MKYLFLALLIVPSLGFAKSLEEGQTIGSPNGRFVLGQISSMREDQFLLDTRTGETWQLASVVDKNERVFIPMKFIIERGGICSYSLTNKERFPCFDRSEKEKQFPEGSAQ